MQIDILYQYDSQIKVFNALESELSEYSITGILIDQNFNFLSYIKQNIKTNIIILTISASEIRKFMLAFRKYYLHQGLVSRPYIIAMLVGLTLNKVFWSTFHQRLEVDMLLVNNKTQLKKLLTYNGFSNFTGKCLTSLPIIFDKYKSSFQIKNTSIKMVLFVVQTNIPAARIERKYVCHKLIEYASTHSQRTIVIKPRVQLHEKAAHEQKFPYEELLKQYKNLPKNIIVSHDPIEDLLMFSDLVLTFSSTVALEALILKKQVAIVGDLGLSDATGIAYFDKSNLITSFTNIIEDKIPEVCPIWLSKELDAPTFPTVLRSLSLEIKNANLGILNRDNNINSMTNEFYDDRNPIISNLYKNVSMIKKKFIKK